MIVKKRFSFVQFLNENSAAQAIRQENGKEFLGHKMGNYFLF
jgi:RNA recognition motif.